MKELVVQCTNGHFFDSNLYETCPHCGAYPVPTGNAEPDIVLGTIAHNEKKKKKFSLFGHHKNDGEITQVPTSMEILNGMSHSYNSEPSYFDILNNNYQSNEKGNEETCVKKDYKDGITRDIWGGDLLNKDNDVDCNDFEDSPIENDEELLDCNNYNEENEPQSKRNDLKSDEEINKKESLADVVKKVSANTDGKTFGYFMATSHEKEMQKNSAISSEPVVGWLVCIHGPHFGESFNISTGRNTIGRSPNNKIIIANDQAISREKHALLIYEPRKREFYLSAGDGTTLSYVNDEAVLDRKLLSKNDIIEMGSCKFLLFPLCGEDFSWEEYISKEQQ